MPRFFLDASFSMTRFSLVVARPLRSILSITRFCLVLALVSGAWMSAGSFEGRAQDADSCAETLSTAEKVYRNRNYEKAVSLAEQCTDAEAVGDETAVRAYRVITLASLRMGALVQARSAVTNILQINPTYTADQVNDPPSYTLFVSMMRKRVDTSQPAEEETETTQQGEEETTDQDATDQETADQETTDEEATDSEPSDREPTRSVSRFFVKPLGIGFSDYTGDMPAQSFSHPLDFQEFIRGSGFPFMLHGELGYQFARQWSFVLGFQIGNYPIIGYNTGDNGISDSWRYTPQLLVRHVFGLIGESLAFYLDGGLNATFGGKGVAKTGYGPSVGGGVDIPVGESVSFFVESRFNFTLPDDAIDGSDGSNYENIEGSSTGPFDSVNQLLGTGLRVRF